MMNKMDDENGPSVIHMNEFTYVPNFEIRPMFSIDRLKKFDIFQDGKEIKLSNMDIDKFANYLEPVVTQEHRDVNKVQKRFITLMTYCKTEDYISKGI